MDKRTAKRIVEIDETIEYWPEICLSPDHNPPTMIVLPPGKYIHKCPDCGKTTTLFTVPQVIC